MHEDPTLRRCETATVRVVPVAADAPGAEGAAAFISRISDALMLAMQPPSAQAVVIKLEGCAAKEPMKAGASTCFEKHGRELSEPGLTLALALRDAPFPVVVAQDGVAGGLSCLLVLMADAVVATDAAGMIHPYRKHPELGTGGLVPRLVEVLGPARTFEFILLGDVMPAAVANKAGLVKEIVAPNDLEGRAIELARGLGRSGGAPPMRRFRSLDQYELPTGHA